MLMAHLQAMVRILLDADTPLDQLLEKVEPDTVRDPLPGALRHPRLRARARLWRRWSS